MNETFLKIAFRVIDKILSARFVIVIMTTITACFLSLAVLYITWKIEKLDVGIPVVMGFFATWGLVVKDYFNKTDRKEQNP